MKRNCSVCNIKIDKNNYIKNETVSNSCYKKNRRKNINNNSLIQNQQSKSDNNNEDNKKRRKVVNSVNSRTVLIGFSNCRKTYLMNHFLHQKQEPIFIITKSLNQYPNIKAQTSDEIQTLEHYENSIVVFDDMSL